MPHDRVFLRHVTQGLVEGASGTHKNLYNSLRSLMNIENSSNQALTTVINSGLNE